MSNKIFWLLLTLLWSISPISGWAFDGHFGGHHGGGHHGGGHFGGGHFGGHGYGIHGFDLGLNLNYGLGYYGGYNYGLPYPYYPPVITVPSSPQLYLTQPQTAAVEPPSPQQEPQNYWYYCRKPEGYHPYISKCPDGWMKVVPQPPSQ